MHYARTAPIALALSLLAGALPQTAAAQNPDILAAFEALRHNRFDPLTESVRDDIAGKWCLDVGEGCGDISADDLAFEFSPDGTCKAFGQKAKYEVLADRIQWGEGRFVYRVNGKFYVPMHGVGLALLSRMPDRVLPIRVFDVVDSPLVSQKGNLLGVRVEFSMEVPKARYYDIVVRLHSPDGLSVEIGRQAREQDPALADRTWSPGFLGMHIVRGQMVSPQQPVKLVGATSYQLEADTEYRFRMDLVPSYLMTKSGNFCLWSPEPDERDAPYFEISKSMATSLAYELTLGVHGQETKLETSGRYNLQDFYRGISAEGFSACPAGTSLGGGIIRQELAVQ